VAITTGNGLQFEYETRGAPDAPPVLLVQGLGMPAAMWPDSFLDTLVAEGLRVIAFDNRDSGGSSRLGAAGVPDIPRSLARALLRRPVTAPYTLDDMANDVIAVLNATQAGSAHVVGVSMGGMIAQVLAARHPHRVRSLTSIMSTTGNPHPGIALGKPRALRALLRRPPREPTLEQAVAHLQHVFGVIGSPGFRQDPRAKLALFERAARRGIYPTGTARQLAAIMASGDRRALLHTITAPTLVIHGIDDPLVRVAGGMDTARNIRGARLKLVPGLGHDFPPRLLRGIAVMIAEHCRAAVSGAAAAPLQRAPGRAA
jgi:pimeloyl-ACP methyl ester carboxylesterase